MDLDSLLLALGDEVLQVRAHSASPPDLFWPALEDSNL